VTLSSKRDAAWWREYRARRKVEANDPLEERVAALEQRLDELLKPKKKIGSGDFNSRTFTPAPKPARKR